ncbi:MAG: hypothetical protein QG608_955 [Actinomycetota bacterium]|nr:hypothetical protein [Actinomycetota bacterium]
MSPLFRRKHHDAQEPVDAQESVPDAPEPTQPTVDLRDAEPLSSKSDRSEGPWDVTERPQTDPSMVDLGTLRLLGRDGMELRLEVDEAAGLVTAASIKLAGSAVQLQAFAAPRSRGIWDEIRAEIAAGITRQGGVVDEVPGVFGKELIARIPVRTPDGRSGHQPARFAGIDGPRWFLRAVFHGPAVHDPQAAALLESVVRDVVVVRGSEAMAPRELLSLTLPGTGPAVPSDDSDDADGRPSRDDLKPFERGPEITEIH